jgi:hypothetical protein
MQRRKLMQCIPQSILALAASRTMFGAMARPLLNFGGINSISRPITLSPSNSADELAAQTGVAEHSGWPPILYVQTVRYKPEVSSDTIDQLLTSLQRTLSAIPQIRSIRIGQVIDESRMYDYAVVMEFDTVNDLRTYGNSEIHKNWVKEHNPVALSAGHSTLTLQMTSGQ